MTTVCVVVIASVMVLAGLVQESLAQRQLCGRVLADTLDLVCAGRGFHMGKRNGRSAGRVYGRVQKPPSVAHQVHISNHLVPRPANSNAKRPTDFTAMLRKALSGESMTQAGRHETQGVSSSGHKDLRPNLRPLASTRSAPIADSQVKANDLGSRLRRSLHVQKRSVVDECCIQACNFTTLESYCAAPGDEVEDLSLDQLRLRFGFTSGNQSPRQQNSQTSSQQSESSVLQPTAQINRGSSRDQSNSYFYLSLGQQATRSPLLEKRNNS